MTVLQNFSKIKTLKASLNFPLKIENTEVKNTGWENRRDVKLVKIIAFVYFKVMALPPNRFEIKTFLTKNFSPVLTSFCLVATLFINLTSRGIIGYAHLKCHPRHCTQFVQFRLFLCGKRHYTLCLANKTAEYWRLKPHKCLIRKQVLQVKFTDTIKYYQQSTTKPKKGRIRNSCKKLLKKIQLILQTFRACPMKKDSGS